jgi:hypothetical protein
MAIQSTVHKIISCYLLLMLLKICEIQFLNRITNLLSEVIVVC